ncbi:MAG: nucleotidyltransferase family protein [Bacteroidetes bacterium]|nr:nucleotidyltransferase family protein [Bacteroidota bacterium]
MLKEAIILAGGFGTRLKEAVPDLPKPLAQVAEKPFLDYLLQYLAHYQIKKVVLSVGYMAEKIQTTYGTTFKDIEIVYSHEEEPLGTGGGIRLALEKCKQADVLVLNGDSFFDIDLRAFYDRHSEAISDCSLALRKVSDASRYGTITLGEFDIIRSFAEKSETEKKEGIINAGVYILGQDMYFQKTPAGKKFSIEKDFFEKKISKINMYGFCYDNYFIDIGIPSDYQKAQNDFKKYNY